MLAIDLHPEEHARNQFSAGAARFRFPCPAGGPPGHSRASAHARRPDRPTRPPTAMKPFRSAGLLGLALSLFATASVAQTTGVAGINDYTLNGLVPGSTSCTPLCFVSPLNLTLTVVAPPFSAAVIVWTDCPCRACSIPWPPNACVPAIPFGPLPPCAFTNQSIDFFPVPGCNILWQAT